MKTVALTHLTDIRQKIADLRRMEQTLASTVELCEFGDAMYCPILSVLSE
ncbi:hypothetical protein C9413_04710 [Rhizobium sp. SEMIA 4085]|nr:hypothetical protein [Rhizobium sp. SEMIA 4085]